MKHKNSILIILGNSVSKFGNVFYLIALNLWITHITDNIRLLSYIHIASTLPLIIFNLFGGIIADMFNKKKILIACDLLSGISCILFGILIKIDVLNIPLIIGISFLLGLSMAMFSPTLRAIIPEVIEKNCIKKTNSLTTNLSEVIKISTPVVGSWLLIQEYLDIKDIFILNGITFILSAISEFFLDYKSRNTNKNIKIFQNLKSGFIYISEHKQLLKLIIICACVNFFITGYNLILPFYGKIVFHNEAFYGKALTVEAVGGVVGSLLILKDSSKTNFSKIKKNLFFCGGGLLLTFYINQYIFLLSIFIFGVYLTKFNIELFSYIQINVEKDYLGRVFSIIFFIAVLLMPLGNFIFGLTLKSTIKYIYIFIGIAILLLTQCYLRTPKSKKT